MQEFLDQAFTMPTTVWSVLLIVVLAYWALKLLIGLDPLGGLFDGAELAAEAIGEGAVEGAAEGAVAGAVEGEVEGGLQADAGLDGGSGHGRGWLRLLGFGEVPVILVASLIVGFGWIASYTGSRLFSGLAIVTAGGAGAVLLVALTSIVLAIVLTMITVTPLRRMMHFTPATERRQLVGRIARVTTLRIDDHFGQAEVDDPTGAPILIQARSDVPNGFTRGDLVSLASYDPERESFLVVEAVDLERPLALHDAAD